jgi:ribose/xylose/arabinose/galactoside ABC-type transport system permease subunit
MGGMKMTTKTQSALSQMPKSINNKVSWKSKLSVYTLPLIVLLMWLVIFMFEPRFLSSGNLINLGKQTAIIGIVAIAQTYVIISKGIDLSVGSTVGLSSILTAKLLVAQVPTVGTILIVLLAGVLVGLINGMIIYDAKITPFIATLGTMTIIRGATLMQSDGKIISGIPTSVTKLAESSIFGIPFLIIVLLVIVAIGTIILKYSVFGRSLFSIGSSEEAARISGVNIRWTTYGAYIVSGVLASVAGFLLTSRLASGIPTSGTGYELDSIASAVIGGASLFGAQGSVIGSVIGSLIMGTIRNAGNLLGIEAFWLQIVIGTLLVVVVFFDQLQKRRN